MQVAAVLIKRIRGDARTEGRRGHAAALRAALLASSALVAAALPAAAQDATWLLNATVAGPVAGTFDFNAAANWSPATVPTGTAFFGTSNTTALSFSTDTTIGGWTFNAGAPAYTFTNGRILTFDGAGIIINGGSASITNKRTLRFTNSSSAGSASILNDTTAFLSFFDTSTAGSATITNGDKAAVVFNDNSTAGSASITNNIFSSSVTFNNTSSAGSAHITNNGGISFNNTSSAGTATTAHNRLTEFNDNSTAGSASLTNKGTLEFNDTSTAAAATITNSGLVNVVFNQSSTAGSATIFNSSKGLVIFNDTSSAGSARITNNDFQSIVNFNNTSSAGSASITNNGFVNFNNTSSAGSATITNNLHVNFKNSSSADSASITNNSAATTFILDSASGGAARFILNGTGALDISGLVTGGTTAGSIEGDGNVFLGSKNLTVGGNNLSTTFSGVVQDGGKSGGTLGSFTKTGTGTLTLSGANTYTGETAVDAGTLLVNGSIAASILTTVNPGGTLGGTGTVGNTIVAGGGTFAPGSGAPGTSMTVAGNLAFQSGALYLVQISPSTASFATVTGTATLGGTVQAVLAPGSYSLGQSYTILSAAGGLGGSTFSGVSASATNFRFGLIYTATDVVLTLTGAALGSGASLSGNQQAVAGAINGFFNSGGTLPPNFANLFFLTGGNLANALTLLSGEAATGGQQGAFKLMDQFLGVMLDPFVDGRGGIAGAAVPALGFAPERETLPEDIALAYAKATRTPVYKAPSAIFEPRWSVWGAGYGGYNKTSGDPLVVGSHDLAARTAGFAAGMDYRLAPGTVAGFALAGGGTRWDLAQGLGGGGSDAFQAGVYGATRSGPAYLAAAFAFANHWMSTDRAAPFGNRLTADFDAQSFGGRVEGGYRSGTPIGGVTPYAAVQAQSFRTPGYREVDVTGGGFGLAYNSRTGSDTRSELGARFDQVGAFDRNAVLTLRARLAWAHDWVSDPTLAPVFQTLPGAGFIVNGALPAKDSALASAGAELRLANGVTLLAKFDGEFASHAQTYAGTGTLRWTW